MRQKLTRGEVKLYVGIIVLIVFPMLAIISLDMVDSPIKEFILILAGLVWVIVTVWAMWRSHE